MVGLPAHMFCSLDFVPTLSHINKSQDHQWPRNFIHEWYDSVPHNES